MSDTATSTFFIVMNAASGSADAREEQERIEATLREAGQPYELLAVADPQELHAIARHAADEAQRHRGAIVVAGGDGTINAVLQSALPTGRPFGIIPQGTFNYSGRAHDIPLATEAATQALINANIKRVQVGMLNGRAFLVNASVGLYPKLLQDREAFKQQYGRNRLVAMWAGLATLLQDHRQLALEIWHDDRSELVRTPTLFVGNNALQLEQVGLPEASDIGRRRLAALIVKPTGSAALLWLAVRGMLGRLGEAENVRDFSFKQMTVRLASATRGSIRVATDGEIWQAALPLRFEVAPEALLLMTPAADGG
ncbi:diacylglycerol kinase family enzyme [Povalibacter uvarum]|uniref:Diacylglycerol kinase family enzyme n=1 Tax=Povalibacter uvarum TaxID=732238 RepID=A0A841HRA0_9GAMM|nr:diacylglycerol kinase family protein [Povalibacter uvarum]MBB6095293.1 diacylglycerol kinase family enzyme [Povalibacter uvarum]